MGFQIDLRNILYISLRASRIDSAFEIISRLPPADHQRIYDERHSEVSELLWNQALGLFNILTGFELDFVFPSRWKSDPASGDLIRVFNSPSWDEFPYQSFHAYIHLRHSFVGGRSIDENFIDLFLNFSSDPWEQSYAPLDDDKRILALLHHKLPQITKILTEIAEIVLDERDICVRTLSPLWEEECEIVTGGDAYWIKGVIAKDT